MWLGVKALGSSPVPQKERKTHKWGVEEEDGGVDTSMLKEDLVSSSWQGLGFVFCG